MHIWKLNFAFLNFGGNFDHASNFVLKADLNLRMFKNSFGNRKFWVPCNFGWIILIQISIGHRTNSQNTILCLTARVSGLHTLTQPSAQQLTLRARGQIWVSHAASRLILDKKSSIHNNWNMEDDDGNLFRKNTVRRYQLHFYIINGVLQSFVIQNKTLWTQLDFQM